jgi:hypothetical protein
LEGDANTAEERAESDAPASDAAPPAVDESQFMGISRPGDEARASNTHPETSARQSTCTTSLSKGAMAYAWSQKGVAYIVSSCGKTIAHEQMYISKYENAYGEVKHKELLRPAIAHMLNL